MKIPAIRAKIGIWVYYIAVLSFSEVINRVKDPTKIHKSKILSDLLQRSITNNAKSISDYLSNQDERFFNSLVLAVYDGDPQWHEIRLDYGNDEEYYDIGLLELTGKEKIFPVDGQHRVEGIRLLLSENKESNENEQVPVIFIGHRNDEAGMERARRLFSTLNRYAKPVSKRDIIALDEDDAAAIITRDFIDNYPLFSDNDNRLLDIKGKSIPDNNNTAFTSIISFYECNLELLNLYLQNKVVKDMDGKSIRNSSAKLNRYIRFRQSQSDLDEYTTLCYTFWDAVSQGNPAVSKYLANPPKRNNESMLFRPTSLLPYVKASVLIQMRTGADFISIVERFNTLPMYVTDDVWHGLLWDSENKRMLMKNHKTVMLRLVHLYNKALLSNSEIKSLIKGYATARQIDESTAMQHLDEN